MAAPVALVHINSVAKTAYIKPLSLVVRPGQNRRSTLAVTLKDKAASYRPAVDDEIVVTRSSDSAVIFGGLITDLDDSPFEHQEDPDYGCETRVTAGGYDAYLEMAVVTPQTTFPAGSTLKTIASSLTAAHLTQYGITLSSMANGPTITGELVLDHVPVGTVFSDLSAIMDGWIFTVSATKVLSWTNPSAAPAAPFDVTDATARSPGLRRATWTQSRGQYRNRQFLKIGGNQQVEKTEVFTGDGATMSWALDYDVVAHPGYIYVDSVIKPLEAAAHATMLPQRKWWDGRLWDSYVFTFTRGTGRP